MDRSPGFGSTACNFRPLQTRFPCGSSALHLNLATHRNSPARSTKSTRSRLPYGVALPLLVSIWFQVLFHSPPGVLFTFPSRYWSTIAHQGVFSLSRWSSILPSGFLVPRRTQGLPRPASRLRIREFHPLRCAFPCASPVMSNRLYRHPYNPILRWFGLLRFRSPLLTESLLFSLPAGT